SHYTVHRDLHPFPTRRSSDLVMPTFMAKWSKDLPGCSGHLHESLWTLDGQPVFLDPRGYKGMSKTMQHYVAGQVALLPAMTALIDRKSTRLNSSHRTISYAVF